MGAYPVSAIGKVAIGDEIKGVYMGCEVSGRIDHFTSNYNISLNFAQTWVELDGDVIDPRGNYVRYRKGDWISLDGNVDKGMITFNDPRWSQIEHTPAE